jgi:restriction system protein
MAARRRFRTAAPRRRRDEGGFGGLVILGLVLLWVVRNNLWLIALIVALLFAGFVGYVALKRRAQRQLASSGIAEIDQMNGRLFEETLAAHFRQQGFRVDLTPYRGDFGADLILDRAGIRTAVQAKRWRGNVGVGAIQEIVGAKAYYKCQQAMVVTNSHFTSAARELATANGVILWDRAVLIRELSRPTVTEPPRPNRQLQW